METKKKGLKNEKYTKFKEGQVFFPKTSKQIKILSIQKGSTGDTLIRYNYKSYPDKELKISLATPVQFKNMIIDGNNYIEKITKTETKKEIAKPEFKGKSTIAKRFKNKFTPVVNLELSKIKTRPEIFQGRTVPFAKATVEKIVKEGFDTSQEPIILFRMDLKKGQKQDIVISGHSRFEAAKILKLKTIPVKYFKGTFEDAIDYAIIESNRSGNAEGIESDVKAYIRAKKRGYNKEFLRSIFKTDSYIDTLRNLSYLNANGDFIKELASQSNRSFPYLERNAVWVGNLRMLYLLLKTIMKKKFLIFSTKETAKIYK